MRRKLKEIRIAQNFTQEQIAQQLGISRCGYTNIENGLRSPSLKIALNIKSVLRYAQDDIFTISQ